MNTIFKKSFSFILIFTAFAANGFAQQWTDAQKDVWAGVEKYTSVFASGNLQESKTYFDDSYMDWWDQNRVPINKANVSKWMEYDHKNDTVLVCTLTPLVIWVKGDFAYADYYLDELIKHKDTGKKEEYMENWTDILMKRAGKWILIGDRGGRIPTPQPNN